MADFLERIETAWKTSKLYKRRVSILLLSHDRNYTLERICQRCSDGVLKEAVVYHISALGRKRLKGSGDKVANIPANVKDEEKIAENESLLDRLCKDTQEAGIYIVDDFLKNLDDKDAEYRRHPLGTNRQLFFDLFEKTLNAECIAQVFVFLEHSEKRELIPDIVDAEIQVVEHAYPSHDEVKEIVKKEVNAYKLRTRKTIEEEDAFIGKLSQHLSGFAFSTISWMIRDAFIKYEATGNMLDKASSEKIIEEVKDRKETLIEQQLGMRVLKSTIDKPIGVDNFLAYIEKRRDKICIPGTDRLKGVLFIGPPGTGKSMLAKYLSAYLGKPAIEVRLSSLMSMWMGETERLFQRLTDVLDAMAPVIIYIDEIEKMFSDEGSGSSAGASMVRATGHLLTWMNDTSSPVFIIATANNVARMGEIGLTMTRRGRFDALFYVGYPNAQSRKKLLQHYSTTKGMNLTDEQLSGIVDITRFFTGADINGIVQDAVSECGIDMTKFYDALISVINDHKSTVDAMREMYRANTRGAMKRLAKPSGECESEE